MSKIFSFFLLVMIAGHSYASNIIEGNLGSKIQGEVISTFNYPWSFSFLDNEHLLVATKPGKLWLLDSAGAKTAVKNMVSVEHGGQGGMGDGTQHVLDLAEDCMFLKETQQGLQRTRTNSPGQGRYK